MEAVWPRVVVEEGNLSQAIYELRRALGERPDEHRYIVTVPGRGYQFVADVVRRERPSMMVSGARTGEATLPPPETAHLPTADLPEPRSDGSTPADEGQRRMGGG